ncbi:hypothetical protein NBRC116590_38180 [Pelagimonas sp. KU-00592-HH]|uniref:ferredoxin n=1 Tax=Pelagimonas sp. KU-00592-HH TaxID=3127651 RepID=UPI003101BA31
MTYDSVLKAAQALHLDILGGFHPTEEDGDIADAGTLLMLSPKEPRFWAHFTSQPEYLDGKPDPVDRWSTRVVTDLAKELGARAFFPFTGPPYNPFYSWALKTGRCHSSPINLLVHDRAGLFVSFRGAIALREKLDLPPAPTSPCENCVDKPCLTTCPVNAFATGTYDVQGCRNVMRSIDEHPCLTRGCEVRRACPANADYGRMEEQSSYHMRVFLENDT